MKLKRFPVAVFGLLLALSLLWGQTIFGQRLSGAVVNFSRAIEVERPLSKTNFYRGVVVTGDWFSRFSPRQEVAATTVAVNNNLLIWWQKLIDFLINLRQTVERNWSDFWTGSPVAVTPATTTPAYDLAAIRNELLNELRADLKKEINQALLSPEGLAGRGLVVVPPGGKVGEIQSLFSDPVKVQLDNSGQTGVITPIFRNRQGDSYLFLLTPIKR